MGSGGAELAVAAVTSIVGTRLTAWSGPRGHLKIKACVPASSAGVVGTKSPNYALTTTKRVAASVLYGSTRPTGFKQSGVNPSYG
jgi:hypothetical protein